MAKTNILTEPYREDRAGAYRAEARRVLAGELSKKEYQGYRLGGHSLVYVENAAGDEIAGLDATTGQGIEVLGARGWGTYHQTLGEALNDVLATLRRSVGLPVDAPKAAAPKAAAPKAAQSILTEPYRMNRREEYLAEARRVLDRELSKKEYQGYRLEGHSLVYVENAAGDEIAGLVVSRSGIEVFAEGGRATTYRTLGEALNDVLATLRRSVGVPVDAPFPVAPKAAAPKAAQSILTEPYREDREGEYRAEARRVLAEELSKKEYQGYRLSGDYLVRVENTAGRLVSLDMLTDRGIEAAWPGGARTAYQTLGEALNDVLATLRRSVGLRADAPKAAAPKAAALAASADKFPKRPKGIAATYRYPTKAPPFAIIIAPKCKVPYAVFRKEGASYKSIGGTPSADLLYVEGYLGVGEMDVSGYVRQHMYDGVLNSADRGTGVGPAQYMTGPYFAAIEQGADCPGTFSRKKASDKPQQKNYCYREPPATAAWQSMEDHKVAVEVDESNLPQTIASMTPQAVSAPVDSLFSDPYDFPLRETSYRAVGSLKPAKVKVAVEIDTSTLIRRDKAALAQGNVISTVPKKVSGMVKTLPLSLNIVQEISRQTILDLGITLWIDPDHEDAILNPAVYTQRPAQPYVPTPAALAEVDFSATDSDWVQKIVKFCSERYGLVTPREYVQSFIEAAAGNPTIKIAGAPKVQNPRRRRNPAEDKRTKATLAFLNDEGWD